MKKYISLLSCILLFLPMAFYSCSDDENEKLITPVLELETNRVEFTKGENSRTISVKSNIREWNFTLENPADASWIELSKNGGVKMEVSANLSVTPRETKIIVFADDLKEELIVVQAGN